jgi:hypothetical protein
MLLSDCHSGEWYLIITCENCSTRQPLFHDLSRGRARLRHTYEHSCEKCQRTALYDSDQIERYQHPMFMTMAS